MDCAMCGSKGLFQVEDLPVGPRWFCTEKHFAQYAGLPVKESGYYGFDPIEYEDSGDEPEYNWENDNYEAESFEASSKWAGWCPKCSKWRTKQMSYAPSRYDIRDGVPTGIMLCAKKVRRGGYWKNTEGRPQFCDTPLSKKKGGGGDVPYIPPPFNPNGRQIQMSESKKLVQCKGHLPSCKKMIDPNRTWWIDEKGEEWPALDEYGEEGYCDDCIGYSIDSHSWALAQGHDAEGELEREYFTRFGDERGGKEWGEYNFTWFNDVGDWKPIDKDTTGWDDWDYADFREQKEYELVNDMLSDCNSDLYGWIENHEYGDQKELYTSYEVLNEDGKKEVLGLLISWKEPEIEQQKIQYYKKEPLHQLEFLTESFSADEKRWKNLQRGYCGVSGSGDYRFNVLGTYEGKALHQYRFETLDKMEISCENGHRTILERVLPYQDQWDFPSLEAESKKLPPVEKAIDTGIASGATMEGLETLLAAETFNEMKQSKWMKRYITDDPIWYKIITTDTDNYIVRIWSAYDGKEWHWAVLDSAKNTLGNTRHGDWREGRGSALNQCLYTIQSQERMLSAAAKGVVHSTEGIPYSYIGRGGNLTGEEKEEKGLSNAWDELAGKYDHVSMKKNAESFYAEDKSCECGREGATKFCEWCRYDKCEKCFQEMKDECRHCDGQDKTPDGKWCEYCDGGEKYICHENNIPEFDWAVMEPEYPYDTTKEQMGYAAESFGADAAGFDGGYRCSTCDKQYLYHNDAKHGGCEKDRRLTDEDVGEGCKCMEEAEDRAEWCCTARAESFNAESNGDLQLDESKKRTKMSAIRTGLAITTFGIVLWNLWTNKKQESQISDIMDLV